jgi:hypothetical protein
VDCTALNCPLSFFIREKIPKSKKERKNERKKERQEDRKK